MIIMISKHYKILSLSYIFVAMLLAIFLFSARSGIYYNQFFFWVFVICMLSINLFFICLSNNSSKIHYILFLQMVLFLIIIRIPYRTTFGLYGVDSPTEYYVTMHILKNGWTASDSLLPFSYYNQSNYPFLYFTNIIFSEISGRTILFVENWFPVLLTLVTPFFVYLSSYELFHSKKSALISFYGFSTLYGYMIFHSLTVRESIGFIFFSQIIYLILKLDNNSRSNKFNYTILVLLSIFALILSHHLTSFMLLMFIVVCASIGYFFKYKNISITSYNFKRNYLVNSQLPVLIFTLYIAYWIYAYARVPSKSPLTMLVNSLIQILKLEAGGHSVEIVSGFPDTMRYSILLNGTILFGLIFVFLSALSLFFRRDKFSVYELAFFATASIPGIFGFLSVLKIFGLAINAERFMTFTYFYLLILSGYSALKLISYKSFRNVLLVIFLLFSLFNVYAINPYLYTSNEPDYVNGEIRSYIYYTEYISFKWFGSHSSNILLSHQETARLLVPFIEDVKCKPFKGSIESQIKPSKNENYISIPKKSIPYLSNDDCQYITKYASKIYNNNDSIVIMV